MSREEFEVEGTNGNKVKLAIRNLTSEDYEEAERIYAIKIASLIRASGGKKLLVRNELDQFLNDTGVWTKADVEKVEKLREQIDDLIDKLKNKDGKTKLSDGRKISLDIYDKRMEITKLEQKRRVFDEATIENAADQEKADYFVFASTVFAETGKQYWDSLEEMKNDKLSDAYKNAAVKAIKAVYGIDTELEKSLPENKWLKKYGFVDEKLNFVDRKTGEKVDRSGKPTKSLEEFIQKRMESFTGDVKEENPFIDDDTNEPVAVST